MKKIITLLALTFCVNGWGQCSLTLLANSATICAGGSATMQASGASSYTWMPGGATTSSVSLSPTGTTVYTVTGTTGTCTATTSATITVVNITITANPPFTSICSGSSTTLTASGANTYTWAPASALSSVSGATVIANPATTTIYTVYGGVGPCVVTPATTTVTVNATPSAPVSTSTNTSFCQGSPTALTVNSGTTVALWYSGSNYIQGGSSYTPPNNLPAGTYTYTVKDSIASGPGFMCTSSSITVTVTINPSPSVTYTLVQDAAPHTWDAYSTYSGGTLPYSYSWDWGDGSGNSTSAYPSHTYSVAGTYSICAIVSDANGCVTTYCQNDAVSRLYGNNSTLSNMIYVNVLNGNQAMGTTQLSEKNNQMSIYPNPANSSFTIEITNSNKQTLQIFDVNGKLVLSQSIAGKAYIDASTLSEGVYNVSVINSAETVNKRLVIIK